ncbi:MAG: cytochrome c [Fimbriiglobus sp.]
MSEVAHEPQPVAPAAVTKPDYRPLAKPKALALFGLPLGLMLAAYGGGLAVHTKLAAPTGEGAVPPTSDGAAVFTQHCVSCHGGRGDGVGVAHLDPPARYFGMEKFKLASTTNGVPTDHDLLRVIRHGIPGSAMPAFPFLSDGDQTALVAHVRKLTWRGTYDRMYADVLKKVDDGGDDPEPAILAKKTDAAVVPGVVFTAPTAFPPPTPDSIENGKKLFATTCAGCHGPSGRGDGPQVKDMKNENGTPNKPRDLTAGIYKYGGDHARLFTRIRLGIPGTPMPATPASTVPDKDLADLVNFVRSLPQTPASPTVASTAK